MKLLTSFGETLLATVGDVLPIVIVVLGFQVFVIRQPIAQLKQLLIGFGYVLLGLSLFLLGLEQALFPLGRLMAQQLTVVPADTVTDTVNWLNYTIRSTYLLWPLGLARRSQNPH